MLTIRLVGIMLLISMLTVPVLIAETWSRRFFGIMWLSMAVSAVTSLSGIFVAALIDVPCSSVVVLLQVGIYLCSRLVKTVMTRRLMQ